MSVHRNMRHGLSGAGNRNAFSDRKTIQSPGERAGWDRYRIAVLRQVIVDILDILGRAVGNVNGGLAVRGKKNAQKQGEQKRPGPFHDCGLSVVLARSGVKQRGKDRTQNHRIRPWSKWRIGMSMVSDPDCIIKTCV